MGNGFNGFYGLGGFDGEPENGDITLTQCFDIDQDYGERYTIKRYHSDKAINCRIELRALNPAYKTIVL